MHRRDRPRAAGRTRPAVGPAIRSAERAKRAQRVGADDRVGLQSLLPLEAQDRLLAVLLPVGEGGDSRTRTEPPFL